MGIYILIPIAFFIFAVILRYNKASIKGKYGEKKISTILKSLPNEYHLFNDIYIQDNHRSVQIDHILVSPYGIFVIETKNYSGWIFGYESSEFWTKNVYGNKYKFQNPLKQNYSHVKALESFLGISRNNFIPIVVFLRGATLKCNTEGMVIYSGQLKYVVNSYTKPVINASDIHKFIEKLSNLGSTTKDIRKEHKRNVRQAVTNKKNMIYNGICPKCGNQLIKRKGRYGTFIGCSNYPQCKFTN